MKYTNSPLTAVTLISPNRTVNRNHVIDTITIHCYVGQVTAERGLNGFAKKERQVSCNYVVGYDGKIGLCVEEKDRSWCSGGYDKQGNPIRVNGISGKSNDYQAVTIEVASDNKRPYAITEKAMDALIELCADICQRNGIKRLLWKGDKTLVGEVPYTVRITATDLNIRKGPGTNNAIDGTAQSCSTAGNPGGYRRTGGLGHGARRKRTKALSIL